MHEFLNLYTFTYSTMWGCASRMWGCGDVGNTGKQEAAYGDLGTLKSTAGCGDVGMWG